MKGNEQLRHILKYSSIIVAGGACSWLAYNTCRTYYILTHIMKSNVLECERKRPEFIFIEDPLFKEHLIEIYGEGEDRDYLKLANKYEFKVPSFSKWWESMKHKIVSRLIWLSRNGTSYDRIRAVRMLSTVTSLKEWDYRHLAQQCDALTAIGLARSPTSDSRWFLDPPFPHSLLSPRKLVHELKHLLMAMGPHPCMQTFLDKTFQDFQEIGESYDTGIDYALGPISTHVQDAMKLCVEALLHLSAKSEYRYDLAKHGIIPMLIDVSRHCKQNNELKVYLAKILSNLAMCPELLNEIFRSGWIGILYQWSEADDIRLRGPAIRALANLDRDEPLKATYPARVYLLHPTKRTLAKPKTDVIFVHGLLGGVFVTWRQRDPKTEVLGLVGKPEDESITTNDFHCSNIVKPDTKPKKEKDDNGQEGQVACAPYTNCWPMDWLPNDCDNLRVLGVNYDTALSRWAETTCSCNGPLGVTLGERARDLMLRLAEAGVGQDNRSIVWVAHSMGGLLVKSIIVQAYDSYDQTLRKLCSSTRGVVFLGTPHHGSSLAALTPPTAALLWPSVEVQELRENSPKLINLHTRFLALLPDYPFEVVSVCEGRPTLLTALKVPLVFVDANSADPGVGDFYTAPSDHLGICKPASRQSFFYRRLLRVIKNAKGLGSFSVDD